MPGRKQTRVWPRRTTIVVPIRPYISSNQDLHARLAQSVTVQPAEHGLLVLSRWPLYGMALLLLSNTSPSTTKLNTITPWREHLCFKRGDDHSVHWVCYSMRARDCGLGEGRTTAAWRNSRTRCFRLSCFEYCHHGDSERGGRFA